MAESSPSKTLATADAPAEEMGLEAPIPKGEVDSVYEAKARVLNAAIQEIGMGRYQWQLFIVVGFGWASDNLWPIVTSLICKYQHQLHLG
ncbi:Membrane transporter [Neofusicoccum parvum]|uniref:Membrane transporter n=1 Tax=Neofusicoccum parvum TaxID=310453 RepID=A0ACB5S1L0_9PEZI|nr:Membrane transporter [Neofusicoccum parvum]